ncbi:hypothetical protein E2C01_038873 [Portunus trituberculatus]|uniref:Uncharacterized protein n=1 Tax=Portunus trituberculatus TaxID=210409 RepID=A0A5B7FJ66_PORTR|nr:hypothetical protein [Portunus trituberculatus]
MPDLYGRASEERSVAPSPRLPCLPPSPRAAQAQLAQNALTQLNLRSVSDLHQLVTAIWNQTTQPDIPSFPTLCLLIPTTSSPPLQQTCPHTMVHLPGPTVTRKTPFLLSSNLLIRTQL